MSPWSPPPQHPPQPQHSRASPSEAASARTRASIERLRVDPSTFFRYPIPALHALAGAAAPQELHVIGARPGGGKSLFAHNLAMWLTEQDIPVMVMGTEQSPDVLAIKQACVHCCIPFKLILKPEPDDLANGKYAWACGLIEKELLVMEANAHLLQWSNHEYVDRAALADAVAWAVEEMGARAIIVDHLHHMQHGDGKDPVSELTATVHLLKHLCKRHAITGYAFAQLKRLNDIESYAPPDMEDFAGASAIERTADVAFGLWRPLRQDLTSEELKTLKAQAREGKVGRDDVYMKNTMGVRLLKDRLGDVFGKQTLLEVSQGRLSALAEKDRHGTSYEELRRL